MKKTFFDVFKWILSGAITFGLALIGVKMHLEGFYNKVACIILLVALTVALIIWTVVSLVKKKRFLDNMDREGFQKKLLAERERATEIAIEKVSLLKKLIKFIDVCSIFVLISVSTIIICFFALVGGEGSGACLPIIFGLYAGLYFIRPRSFKINESKSEDYLKESDYPLIYDTARKAANRIGCDGKIKIFVSHDFNASILTISDGYSIRLGSYILDNMSREELYNILLHEFAHVDEKNNEINKVTTYANLLQENDSSVLSVAPYIYLHAKFVFEFLCYQYVCSLMHEDAADTAMREYGNPDIAASMLIKLKFSELYQWERGTYDEENIFESETLIDDCIRRPLRWFKDRMELRRSDWIEMIDSEIISRNATHSTVKMRIEALGVSRPRLIPINDSEAYSAEVDRAIFHMESIVKKTLSDRYSEIREQEYLAPKRVIDEWESAGKPITREGYQEVLMALFSSYKINDFVNLCCQIIEEIPEPANYFAHHMYGMYLLHKYDESGIEHLYKAIDLNHNIWDEALDTIGQYACIVGKQDELDKYRERAARMVKEQIDVYEKMDSLGVRDKVVEEKLPDGMLEDMISYFEDIDDGVINEIRMVRKILDETHFVTCIVVSPRKKADPKKFGEMMEKIFQYLDKSSDWQFALFDMRNVPRGKILGVKNSLIYKGK